MARPKGPKMKKCIAAVEKKSSTRNAWAICTEQAKKERRKRSSGWSGFWR